MLTYDFTGQTAFVTGASTGMGAAAARAFAEAAAAVALVDINPDALEQIAAELSEEGHQVLALPGGVSQEREAAAVQRTVAAFNNAGIMIPLAPVAPPKTPQHGPGCAHHHSGP